MPLWTFKRILSYIGLSMVISRIIKSRAYSIWNLSSIWGILGANRRNRALNRIGQSNSINGGALGGLLAKAVNWRYSQLRIVQESYCSWQSFLAVDIVAEKTLLMDVFVSTKKAGIKCVAQHNDVPILISLA